MRILKAEPCSERAVEFLFRVRLILNGNSRDGMNTQVRIMTGFLPRMRSRDRLLPGIRPTMPDIPETAALNTVL